MSSTPHFYDAQAAFYDRSADMLADLPVTSLAQMAERQIKIDEHRNKATEYRMIAAELRKNTIATGN